MINKLANEKMCQKAWPCITSWYWHGWEFTDNYSFFHGKYIFETNIPLNVKPARGVFKNFCYYFSDLPCTGNIFLRFNNMFFTVKV